MKTITPNLLKGLLVIILFTGVPIVLSAAQTFTAGNTPIGGTISERGSAPVEQVDLNAVRNITECLINEGYTVIDVRHIDNNDSWFATVIDQSGEFVDILVNTNTNTTQIISQTDVAL